MDDHYMEEALKEAELAKKARDVPVGAVVVYQDKIIGRGHNRVEAGKNATLHAEMEALKEASRVLGDWRLLGCTLYTTLEPCTMCLGAAYLSRVEKIVYGAKDLRHGACGSWVNLPEKKHPTHSIEIKGGIREDECKKSIQDFFKERRMERKTVELFDAMIDFQEKKLLKLANEIRPRTTTDDILQPNDYEELENHPFFRYEEGVLKGIHSARAAFLAECKKGG